MNDPLFPVNTLVRHKSSNQIGLVTKQLENGNVLIQFGLVTQEVPVTDLTLCTKASAEAEASALQMVILQKLPTLQVLLQNCPDCADALEKYIKDAGKYGTV